MQACRRIVTKFRGDAEAAEAGERRAGGLDQERTPSMKQEINVGQPPTRGGEALLTRKEVAARFEVDVRTIDNWRSRYGMPHYRIGGQVRFVGSEVDGWMKGWRRGGPVAGRTEGHG